eukprot:GHUV01021424.1.p1 GENE.GHUV01021424.1~~GHUV01021424.1.p1  ORF type:complete len:514 (+),score=162.14 GHUV01021424.1:1632-3173(+)
MCVLLQAAAAGQKGISFGSENHTGSAREDLRGQVQQQGKWVDAFPQELKANYHTVRGNADDGLNSNMDAAGKLLKVILAKYNDQPVHIAGFMARIEAVWFIEFKFEATSQVQPAVVGQLEQVSGPTAGGTQAAGSVNSAGPAAGGTQAAGSVNSAGPAAGGTHAEGSSDSTGTKYAIEQLQSVTVTPPFPPKDVLAEGLICKSPYHVVKALEQQHHQNPEAISKLHMADLLLHPKAGPSSSGKAPPGFRLMVQYVNTISCMRGLPPAKLVAEYSRSDGGVDDSRDVDLSLVMVEYAGPRSVVLRLPSEDYIIKISTDESIGREVAVHRIADLSGNEHLRKMHAVGYGRVAGAGEGLHFIALEHYCQLKISRQHVAERAELLWQQAHGAVTALHLQRVLHREIKPSNILLLSPTHLLLNDFDVSCTMADTVERAKHVGTLMYRSPRMDDPSISGWTYTEVDDMLSLALTFVDLLRGNLTSHSYDSKIRVLWEFVDSRQPLRPCKQQSRRSWGTL